MKTSGKSCREIVDVYLLFEIESEIYPRHCERSEAIHYHRAKKEWIASLRSQ